MSLHHQFNWIEINKIYIAFWIYNIPIFSFSFLRNVVKRKSLFFCCCFLRNKSADSIYLFHCFTFHMPEFSFVWLWYVQSNDSYFYPCFISNIITIQFLMCLITVLFLLQHSHRNLWFSCRVPYTVCHLFNVFLHIRYLTSSLLFNLEHTCCLFFVCLTSSKLSNSFNSIS